jgi:hypothetical protein
MSSDSIVGCAKPVVGCAKPVVGFAKPVVGFAKPIVDLAKPVVGFAKPIRQSAERFFLATILLALAICRIRVCYPNRLCGCSGGFSYWESALQ